MEQKNQEKSSSSKQMQKKVGKYVLFMNEDQVLGKGQFGVVYRALDDQKKMYAVKMISMVNFKQNPFDSKTKKNSEQLKREIDVMKAAKHKNLVTLYEIQQSPNNLYLFLEYCNGGNLKEYLKKKKKLSQEEGVDFFRQLCHGYKVLNEKNILHRDIKLENVMLNDCTPKLCDFGFGKIVEEDVNEAKLQSYKCTPIYAAPQILVGEPYSSKCDIWSMGCMLYEMVFGYQKYPFIGRNQVELIQNQKKVMDSPLQVPENDLDPLLIDVIQKMLRYRESDRVSWNDLLNHPIFMKTFGDTLDVDDSVMDDGDSLSHSIIKNKKTLQKNILVEERQIYKNQDINKSIKTQEENSGNNLESYLNQYKRNEQYQYVSSKVDKLFLYYRNQGIFASITMQNFWGVKHIYKLEGYILHMIVYCLGGYYAYMLEFLLNILNQKIQYNFGGILDKSDFEVYLGSSNIIQTKEKIQQDCQAAKEFFIDIEKSVQQEAQKIFQKNEKNVFLQDFLNFVQEDCKSYKEYLNRLRSFSKQVIAKINVQELKNRNALKGLYSLIIFCEIESHFPVEKYDQVDMKLFYEQQLNTKKEEQFIKGILDYIQ